MHSTLKAYVSVGNRVLIECPYSEVCMHMRIAGRLMFAELKRSEAGYYSVQLWNGAGEEHGMFSFPIGVGEAGMYYEEREGGLSSVYYYLSIYKVEELAERFGPEPINSRHGG